VSTQSAAARAFSEHAPEYTAVRRRLVPGFDAFYGNAVRALEVLASGALERVLDLGAGTGLMSAAVAQAFPAARFELLDGSPEMLAEAQVRLGHGRDASRGPV
jgi:tRNA (cmo5U34)-methyltransferase